MQVYKEMEALEASALDEEALQQQVSGPTFEDLAIDPDLDDVERVVRYSTGTVELQRLVHVAMLGDTALAAGFEVSRLRLFPLADSISRDQEMVVRQHLAAQLAALCEFCHNEEAAAERGERDGERAEEAYSALVRVLLPVFRRLVSDPEQEVREEASIALIQVAAYVREDDLMEHVLSIVLELAHDEENENGRITAAGLLNGLASRFGPVLCQQFCVPEMISLGQDPNFKVRRAVAYSLDKLLTMGAAELSGVGAEQDRLLACFEQLCSDTNWVVRKACADSLALIAESVPMAGRQGLLLKLSDALAVDRSRWVRGALSQRLGRFIASLSDTTNADANADANANADAEGVSPRGGVPEVLVRRFADMAMIDQGDVCWINKDAEKPSLPNARRTSGMPSTLRETAVVLGQSMDFASNIMFCCAFSFPAVVMASPRRWADLLLPAFRSLVRCDNASVRRTMAYSLHELARILGPDTTEQVLFPVANDMLRDVDEVRFGIVETLGKLFAALAPHRRGHHVRLLTRLMPDEAGMLAGGGSSSASDSASDNNNQNNNHGADDTFDGASDAEEEDGDQEYQVGMGGTSSIEDLHRKWRFRHALASQLPQLCELFESAEVFDVVVPIAVKLSTDDVEIIRDTCCDMVGPCLRRLRLGGDNNKHATFQDMVLRFAFSDSYFERQQYVNICCALVKDPVYAPEFTKALLDPLLLLADDPVPNVRLVLASALASNLGCDQAAAAAEGASNSINNSNSTDIQSCSSNHSNLSQEFVEAIRLAQRKLQVDKDRDVALAAGGDEEEWLERRLEQSQR